MDLWERYHRQIIFPEWGEEAQKKLAQSRAVLVGCGALGSGIAMALVRSGIGELTIVDQDLPEISNLHRQFLFDEDDVKRAEPKAIIACKKLKKANSQVKLKAVPERLDASNIEKICKGTDIIFDGTDNLLTRYIINDFAVKNQIPWIYGGVIGASGMMMPIIPQKTPCLRCLFPEPEKALKTPATAELGVMNPAPLLLSALEVIEGLKILTGRGKVFKGLFQFDLWEFKFSTIEIKILPHCPCCQKGQFEFLEKN